MSLIKTDIIIIVSVKSKLMMKLEKLNLQDYIQRSAYCKDLFPVFYPQSKNFASAFDPEFDKGLQYFVTHPAELPFAEESFIPIDQLILVQVTHYMDYPRKAIYKDKMGTKYRLDNIGEQQFLYLPPKKDVDFQEIKDLIKGGDQQAMKNALEDLIPSEENLLLSFDRVPTYKIYDKLTGKDTGKWSCLVNPFKEFSLAKINAEIEFMVESYNRIVESLKDLE